MNDNPVKYEFDKEIGAIMVDRFMQAPMFYPCNYGFIPHTLSQDGDPADVLVMSQYPIIPGAIIKVRPVGVLIMEDESGIDEKILAVPVNKIDVTFESIKDIDDVPQITKDRINHFFENYKKLEKGLTIAGPTVLSYVILIETSKFRDQLTRLGLINGSITLIMTMAPTIGSYLGYLKGIAR
eukprot:jgi/Mesvir1/25312/Mv20378-RA.1